MRSRLQRNLSGSAFALLAMTTLTPVVIASADKRVAINARHRVGATRARRQQLMPSEGRETP